MQERIDKLVKEFNGAIKYAPMLQDHPDWSDKECLEFARKWHPIAVKQLRQALNKDEEHWHDQTPCWNDRIPYCRNLPTNAMIKEALSK